MRLKMFIKICGHFILICIHSVQSAVISQRFGYFKKSVWGKKIVMIQNPRKFTGGHGKSRVCISGYSQIFRKVLHADTLIPGGIFFQHRSHVLIFRTSICNAQLPVFICLCQEGVHHLGKKQLWRAVSGHSHTDQRFIIQPDTPLAGKFRLVRNIRFIPGSVWNLLRFKALMEPDPEFFRTVMFQITESLLHSIRIQFFHHASPLDPASCILLFIHIYSPQILSILHIFYFSPGLFYHCTLFFARLTRHFLSKSRQEGVELERKMGYDRF